MFRVKGATVAFPRPSVHRTDVAYSSVIYAADLIDV